MLLLLFPSLARKLMRSKQLVTYRMGKVKDAGHGEKRKREEQEGTEKKSTWVPSKSYEADLLELVSAGLLQSRYLI